MTSPPRLHTLDFVRGVAVLGILLLNIVAFAMPEAAYSNPRSWGGAHGADLAAYLVNFVLFDGKMRGLFSVLFGASLLLVADRAEAAGASPASVHYRRMAWLLVFGVAHLLLVWSGDILAHYAILGMVAFLFRELPVSKLLGFGIVLVLVQTAMFGSMPFALAAAEAARPGSPAAASLAEFQRMFGAPPAMLANELALYRGSYAQILHHRLAHRALVPLQLSYAYGPETLAYMLFGMAGLRSGMLAGEWPRARTLRWLAIGFGIGIPAWCALAALLVHAQFSIVAVTWYVVALATPVRPPMILGWACLLLLLARPGGPLTTRLAAAGRMAFTNYLATSLICTTLFYGYGLGWFGHLSRWQLYPVVLAIWALILLWSRPWLSRFRYGPLEWLWRSLARGSLQPMARQRPANASH